MRTISIGIDSKITTMAKINSKQVTKAMESLAPGWRLAKQDTTLRRKIKTKDFMSAFTLVARIAVHAEVMQHHPDIQLSYGSVTLSLTTHDIGGLTRKDIQLAKTIDDVCAG